MTIESAPLHLYSRKTGTLIQVLYTQLSYSYLPVFDLYPSSTFLIHVEAGSAGIFNEEEDVSGNIREPMAIGNWHRRGVGA